MKICPDAWYGDAASAASRQSFKIWVDNSEDQFSAFESGKKYDCKVANDRDALAKIVTKQIQGKRAGCLMTPPRCRLQVVQGHLTWVGLDRAAEVALVN
jgi:hypothetical protein